MERNRSNPACGSNHHGIGAPFADHPSRLRPSSAGYGLALLALTATISTAAAAQDVLTWHNDTSRTGQYLSETQLSPANVSSSQFGRRFTQPVDGYMFAQPLYKQNVAIAGKGTHNVVFAVTENDSVYAFDADSNSGANAGPLWHVNLVPAGASPGSGNDISCGNMGPLVGITGTPVIDPGTGTIYLVATTKENGVNVQRLHALDIGSGTEKMNGPAVIQTANFDPLRQNQRPGLLLTGGTICVAWASHCDVGPYHGWLMTFSASNVQTKLAELNTTPNGSEAGVWMTGAGPSVDAGGNIFFSTGNGTFTADQPGGKDFGECVMKVSSPGLGVLDWFAPSNWNSLNNSDTDIGSTGVLLLPTQAGSHPNVCTIGGKQGLIYVINRDNMSHVNATDQVVQEFDGGIGGIFATGAYFNGKVYYKGSGGPLKAFTLNNSILTFSSQSAAQWGFPGSTPSISANGAANGIVWTLENNANPAVLRAFDASDVSKELFSSSNNPADNAGPGVKFTLPTIANGKVYVGSQTELTVYGLSGVIGTPPAAPSNLAATAVSSSQINLAWTSHSTNETGFKIFRKTGVNGTYAEVATVGAGITTYSDTGLHASTQYFYQVKATNGSGDSAASNEASATTFAAGTLVGYWPLDEGSGTTAADASGNGNAGTLAGEYTWITPGKVGAAALQFSGTGVIVSHVAIPNLPIYQFTATHSFTLAAWVNPTKLKSAWVGVLTKSRDAAPWYGIWINPSNQWVFGGPTNITGPAATTGWQHVAIVQDGAANVRALYVDGVQVATGTAQAANGTGDLWLGESKSVEENFAGIVDDVRLYSIALSQSQIAALPGGVTAGGGGGGGTGGGGSGGGTGGGGGSVAGSSSVQHIWGCGLGGPEALLPLTLLWILRRRGRARKAASLEDAARIP